MGYYSALEEKGILPHAVEWMNLEGIMLISKMSQSQKDECYMIPLIRGTQCKFIGTDVTWRLTGAGKREAWGVSIYWEQSFSLGG